MRTLIGGTMLSGLAHCATFLVFVIPAAKVDGVVGLPSPVGFLLAAIRLVAIVPGVAAPSFGEPGGVAEVRVGWSNVDTERLGEWDGEPPRPESLARGDVGFLPLGLGVVFCASRSIPSIAGGFGDPAMECNVEKDTLPCIDLRSPSSGVRAAGLSAADDI